MFHFFPFDLALEFVDMFKSVYEVMLWMNSLQAASLQPSSRIPLAAHACTYDDSAAHMQSSVLSQLQLSYMQFCNTLDTLINKQISKYNYERQEISLHLLLDKHQDWLRCDMERRVLTGLTAGHTSAGHISLLKGFIWHINCYNMFIYIVIIIVTWVAIAGSCKKIFLCISEFFSHHFQCSDCRDSQSFSWCQGSWLEFSRCWQNRRPFLLSVLRWS